MDDFLNKDFPQNRNTLEINQKSPISLESSVTPTLNPQKIDIQKDKIQETKNTAVISEDREKIERIREQLRSTNSKEEANMSESDKEYITKAEARIKQTRISAQHIEGLKAGSTYRAELVRHQAPFTTTITGVDLLLNNQQRNQLLTEFSKNYPDKAESIAHAFQPIDEQWQQRIREISEYMFEGVVEANAFKWMSTAGTDGIPFYAVTDEIAKYLDQHPQLWKTFRGHNIFWNRQKDLPFHLRSSSKEHIVHEMINQRLEIIDRYPKIEEWDILNEPLKREPYIKHGVDENQVVFDPEQDIDVFVELFKKAKEHNPKVHLFVNEYSILTGEKTEEYAAFIRKMLDKGAPIDGIGIQGHFFPQGANWRLPTMEEIGQRIDTLARIGLPIKITELDLSDDVVRREYPNATPDQIEKIRATYLQGVMTVAYSNPSVEQINIWGFDPKTHWLGEGAALVHNDGSLNKVGEAYDQKVHHDWSTDIEVTTNSKGEVNFNGFQGEYRISKA